VRQVDVRSGVSGALVRTILRPPTAGSSFAWAVSGGDFDNDGVGDVVASSYMESGAFPGSGVVRVFSGATGNALLTISGPAGGARFGESLDTLGDVDHDGFIDLIVGASGINAVLVIRGSNGSTMRTITAATGESFLGSAVASAGDADGDGTRDYLVAGQAGNAGFVDMYSGAAGTLLHRFLGSQTFGQALSDAGDVDHDGRDDVLIGAYAVGASVGHAFVYSGASYAQIYDFAGSCNSSGLGMGFDAFGASVAGVGDVDLDSFADVAVGATRTRYVSVFSGRTGLLLGQVFENIPPNANTIRVCGMGDLDGDGDSELMIGDVQYSSSTHFNAGRVRVFSSIAPVSVGTLFGFGDGSGGACPCNNYGQPGAGCANSTGLGAELHAFGSSSVTGDELHFELRDVPPAVIGLVGSGSTLVQLGNGVGYGDGLRVTSSALKRSPLLTSCSDGALEFAPSDAFATTWLAGQTRYYQAYYRDGPGPCGSGFNVSNGVAVVFTP